MTDKSADILQIIKQRADASSGEKWVPGPWHVGPVDDTTVFAADGSEIAAIDGDYNQPETWPIMEANARLISAAPELVEALVAFMKLAWNTHHSAPEYDVARAALAKARGEA